MIEKNKNNNKTNISKIDSNSQSPVKIITKYLNWHTFLFDSNRNIYTIILLVDAPMNVRIGCE